LRPLVLLEENCSQAEAARRLGVHRSTITRDMQALRGRSQAEKRCPLCGWAIPTWATLDGLEDLLGDL
jgi:hypothetical protein